MVDGLHRVVITGLGAVTPIGNTVQDYWNGLTSGRSRLTIPCSMRPSTPVACGRSEGPRSWFYRTEGSQALGSVLQVRRGGSQAGGNHAGLEINDANADRVGAIIGSGVGGLLTMETQAHVLDGKGPDR